MHLWTAYAQVAPDLCKKAEERAKITYKICIGDDDTFDEKYGKLAHQAIFEGIDLGIIRALLSFFVQLYFNLTGSKVRMWRRALYICMIALKIFKEPLPIVRKSWNPMGGTRLYALVTYRLISATSHTLFIGLQSCKVKGCRYYIATDRRLHPL